MKGIIFKELYISRKRFYIAAATYLSILLMCILVKLSAVHGNLRLLNEETVKYTERVTFYLAVFGLLIAIAGFVVNNAESDKTTHWDNYRRTIPYTEKQIVGAVYISNAIMLGSAIIVHTLVSLVVCAIFGEQFEAWFFFAFIAFCLIIYLVNAFSLFCQYRFRDPKKAKLVYSAVLFVIYFGVCTSLMLALVSNGSNDDPAKTEQFLKDTGRSFVEFVKKYSWTVFVATAALITLLFFASVKACARPADSDKPPKEEPKKTFFGKLKAAAEGDDN